MKIAFELEKTEFGGAERVMLTLIKEFRTRGIDIVLFTFNPEFDETCVSAKVIKIEFASKFKQVLSIGNCMKKEHIDVLVLFSLHTICYLACKLFHIPFVYSLRNDPLQVDYDFVKKRIMHDAAMNIFQTKKIMSMFSDRECPNKTVIYNPIMDENLHKFSEEREKRIVVIARHSEEKNIEMAIKAFARTRSDGYVLELYGQGELTSSYILLAKELGISEKVVIKGQVKRVIDHIYNAEILLLTSNLEGMPNALIEGLSNGLACISTRFPSGAAEELINDGVNGFTIDMNDEATLTDKIQTLIADECLRRSIQKEAFKIRDFLGKLNIVSQWLGVLSKIKK